MNIMTKSLKIIRVLCGGPGSDIVFIIMYTCQGCGWAPRCEYDYLVIPGSKTSKQAGWYCARCGCKYCTTTVGGAFGIVFKDKNLAIVSFNASRCRAARPPTSSHS